MAFDLVQYFIEQSKNQKPLILPDLSNTQRNEHLQQLNVLTLASIIHHWESDPNQAYLDITSLSPDAHNSIVGTILSSKYNESSLNQSSLKNALYSILALQTNELKQLHDISLMNQNGLAELLLGQIEHLSGQADDWVWLTSNQKILLGSKPIHEEHVSLETSIQEFNQMVQQTHQHEDIQTESTVATNTAPTWALILEPIVAIAILSVLWCAVSQLFK